MADDSFIEEIRRCAICAGELPLAPRPILQFSKYSKVLLIGQAPGLKAREARQALERQKRRAIAPVAWSRRLRFLRSGVFCNRSHGLLLSWQSWVRDLPPRLECRAAWLEMVIDYLEHVRLTILAGKHAIEFRMGSGKLEQKIKESFESKNNVLALPHPSPLNNIWLSKNRWFEERMLPQLRQEVGRALKA